MQSHMNFAASKD